MKHEITCICPNGMEYTKEIVITMKEFRKIVMNYLKIKRIENESK